MTDPELGPPAWLVAGLCSAVIAWALCLLL